jgi:pyridoxal phosphate enzyme (YggS family)
MAFESLPANLSRVREEISRIQTREGLQGEVRIVAVTKGHSADAPRAAVRAGLTEMGENRVQEGVGKIEELIELPANWHLIGHLQTNKAKHVPGRFSWVHSVDSARIVHALQTAAEQRGSGQPLGVLVQVNVSGELQKSGCDPEIAGEIAQCVDEAPALQLEGLMTMAPYVDDERVQRAVFARLRRIQESLEGAGLRLPELSMGMSGDYGAAVAEGATILRLGTALFGERQK